MYLQYKKAIKKKIYGSDIRMSIPLFNPFAIELESSTELSAFALHIAHCPKDKRDNIKVILVKSILLLMG